MSVPSITRSDRGYMTSINEKDIARDDQNTGSLFNPKCDPLLLLLLLVVVVVKSIQTRDVRWERQKKNRLNKIISPTYEIIFHFNLFHRLVVRLLAGVMYFCSLYHVPSTIVLLVANSFPVGSFVLCPELNSNCWTESIGEQKKTTSFICAWNLLSIEISSSFSFERR